MNKLTILGGGRAGLSLGVALAQAGVQVRLVVRREARREAIRQWLHNQPLPLEIVEELLPTPLLILAVPDRALPGLAQSLPPELDTAVWLHVSGAVPWQVLEKPSAAAEMGSLHPLAALPEPLDLPDPLRAAEPLLGATFAVAGTQKAQEAALELVKLLHGRAVQVTQRGLYHAAAALAANDLVALLELATQSAVQAGLSPVDARLGLLHLMQTSLDALKRLPPETPLVQGLTGAMARGDAPTLRLHLDALHDQPAQEVHRALSRVLLEVLRQEGRLGPASLAALDLTLTAEPH